MAKAEKKEPRSVVVYLDTGIEVEVPDDLDVNSDAGFLHVKKLAAAKFRMLLEADPNEYSVTMEE